MVLSRSVLHPHVRHVAGRNMGPEDSSRRFDTGPDLKSLGQPRPEGEAGNATQADQGRACPPLNGQPAPKACSMLGQPSTHPHLHWKKVSGIKGPGRCELCFAVAQQKGCMQVTEPASSRVWGRKRGQRAQKKQRLLPTGKPVPQTSFACGVCKVRLCKKKGKKEGCFHKWDHELVCAPCDRLLVF